MNNFSGLWGTQAIWYLAPGDSSRWIVTWKVRASRGGGWGHKLWNGWFASERLAHRLVAYNL